MPIRSTPSTRGPDPAPSPLLRLLVEVDGAGVDAVPQAGRRRTVGEDVAEVAAAPAARHLGPEHPIAPVLVLLDLALGERPGEARPAAAGVELRVRGEELLPAAGASIHAGVLRVPIPAGEGPLRPLLPQDAVLLGRQLLPPLGLGLL